jgi:hypothetical protein
VTSLAGDLKKFFNRAGSDNSIDRLPGIPATDPGDTLAASIRSGKGK